MNDGKSDRGKKLYYCTSKPGGVPFLMTVGLLLFKSGLPTGYLSRGYLHPLLNVLGVFSPPLHQRRGYHSVFNAASLSQAMSEDSK